MAGFPIGNQLVLFLGIKASEYVGWCLPPCSLPVQFQQRRVNIPLDLLVSPSICQRLIKYEEGQQRIRPRNSLKWDHYYCSPQRPALSTSPAAKESIFLICSCPSPLLGRIDVSDIWNHKLTRGGIEMKKLHFAAGLDEHIWLMAISCCILCWLWLCKNFKLKFQMTGDTENIVLTPSTMSFYRLLPNMFLGNISLCILNLYIDQGTYRCWGWIREKYCCKGINLEISLFVCVNVSYFSIYLPFLCNHCVYVYWSVLYFRCNNMHVNTFTNKYNFIYKNVKAYRNKELTYMDVCVWVDLAVEISVKTSASIHNGDH